MGNSQGVVLMVVGIVALGICLILPRLLRRRDGGFTREGTFGPAAGEAEVRLQQVLTDIQDLSREHIAKLDGRIRMMSQLLAECDRKKEELEKLMGPEGTMPPPVTAASPPPPVRPSNPLHDQVFALQDAGRPVDDICGETGLEKGEVELIMGLRRVPPAVARD